MPGSRDATPSPGAGPSSVPEGYLTVARISKPRGRRGEVAARLFTDFPENLLEQKELFLWDGKSEPRRVAVAEAWLHGGRLILRFEGCDSIEAAQQFSGLEVLLPRAQATPLPAGAHYLHELEGCRVVDLASGQELGAVREVQGLPGNFRLAIETPEGRELLVPFAEEFCRKVDIEAKRIEVALPDGLLGLND